MDELQEFPHLVFCNGLSGHRVVDYHTSKLESEGILHENVIIHSHLKGRSKNTSNCMNGAVVTSIFLL